MPAIPGTIAAEQVRPIVAEILGLAAAEIGTDTLFHEELGVSSLEKAAIIARIEKEFEISLTDAEAAGVNSLRDAGALLTGKGSR
jgi:acyl carrier protein